MNHVDLKIKFRVNKIINKIVLQIIVKIHIKKLTSRCCTSFKDWICIGFDQSIK